MQSTIMSRAIRMALTASLMLGSISSSAYADLSTTGFTAGNIVISTYSGSTLDAASAITLKEFSLGAGNTSASYAGSLTLAQTNSGNNSAISGEYGTASEGLLQQTANGQYLTMMGYGVNANTFNSYISGGISASPYGATALGQTTSLTAAGQIAANPAAPVYTTVSRVVALVGADASVDTSTALTGVFNTNNPRSVASVDGSSFYVSGQASSKTDPTQGVFYTTLGSSTATAIDTSTDTRSVEIINNGNGNQLYVSRDYNPPGTASATNPQIANVDKLTTASGTLPTSAAGTTETIITPGSASVAGGNQASIDLPANHSLDNGVNNVANSGTGATNRDGSFVYLSPEQFFMASSTVMYVADSGQPKNGNVNKAAEGEGGLQRWDLNTTTGIWSLSYDLVAGLHLVNNDLANAATPTANGVTGLLGLTGEVIGNQVYLFATSYGLNELSQSYLYEITDNLNNKSITDANAANETFTTLYTAANGEAIRGIAFAPTAPLASVPLPPSLLMMLTGLGLTGILGRRSKHAAI